MPHRPSRSTRASTRTLARALARTACVALPFAALACSDGIAPVEIISPLDVLVARVRIDQWEFALGDTAWVTVTLRNPTSLSLTTSTTDGCPLLEPVVRAERSTALRTFLPSCLGPEGAAGVDPSRATLSIAAGDSVTLRYPFTGYARDVTGTTTSGTASACAIVGPFEVALVTTTGQDDIPLLVSRGPNRVGGLANAMARVIAPEPPPGRCS